MCTYQRKFFELLRSERQNFTLIFLEVWSTEITQTTPLKKKNTRKYRSWSLQKTRVTRVNRSSRETISLYNNFTVLIITQIILTSFKQLHEHFHVKGHDLTRQLNYETCVLLNLFVTSKLTPRT